MEYDGQLYYYKEEIHRMPTTKFYPSIWNQ